jgi:hypothetical protein
MLLGTARETYGNLKNVERVLLGTIEKNMVETTYWEHDT